MTDSTGDAPRPASRFEKQLSVKAGPVSIQFVDTRLAHICRTVRFRVSIMLAWKCRSQSRADIFTATNGEGYLQTDECLRMPKQGNWIRLRRVVDLVIQNFGPPARQYIYDSTNSHRKKKSVNVCFVFEQCLPSSSSALCSSFVSISFSLSLSLWSRHSGSLDSFFCFLFILYFRPLFPLSFYLYYKQYVP